MALKSLTEEIHDWIGRLEYWEQWLAIKILSKQTITDSDVKLAYKYFLEDNGLAEKKTAQPKIKIAPASSSAAITEDFLLSEIKGIKGINALKDEQSIPISKNLSILYGDNGVGKSGYIRILNNAFLSRGDKTLHNNIYSTVRPKEKSCVFKFIDSTNEYELKFPDDSQSYEFSCYSVFDTFSITAHLTAENVIQFLPNGLEFFDAFSSAVTRVQELLENDIRNNSPANDFIDFFDNETSVKKLVENLSGASDLKVILEKSKISSEELIRLAALEKSLIDLKKVDVTKKVKSLRKIQEQLVELKDEFETLNDFFSETEIGKLKKLLRDYLHNKQLSASEGLAQFKTEYIGSIGSDEWKDLLVAAKAFAEIQYEDENLYPAENDFCLLCHQPLSKEAKQLIEAYWKYLTSNAEKDLKEIVDKINEQHTDLIELDTKVLSEDSVISEWLKENSEANLTIWNAQIKSVETLRKQIVAVLKSKKWNDEITTKQISLKAFPLIEKSIQEKISSFNEAEVNRKIKLTEKEIQELKDRKKLATLVLKISEFITKRKWAAKANTKTFNTRKITQQQKDLFTKFVTDEYVKIFNQECEKLDAKFGINISQRAVKGNTLKHLVLAGWTPSQILSEGEQRAISLADFLTEAQMGTKNKGIIFDDPVNSLDHIRRQTIAERLVEESKVRQVIVFTHDITFLLALQTLAAEEAVDCLVTTMRKIGNTPGIINSSLPWLASNVKERVKKLNEAIPNLKKAESGTDPDYYYEEAKKWCGLLRETWERAVEEILLNDAVQRFSPAIQTKRLERAKFTPDLYKEIEKGMSDCSDWVHDQARAINNPPPKVVKLEAFLTIFSEFVKKCR
ncbi:MAG: AAA family ATPase [Bacteroidales bacterium]|nr:AAA family ATPase [Bacteroidales bacterium]